MVSISDQNGKIKLRFRVLSPLDKEEPDKEKAKIILIEKLKKIINDPNLDPLEYGGAYN